MDEIDFWKVLVAIVAIEVTNFYLTNTFPDRTEAEIEADTIRRYGTILVRSAILLASLKNKWPLSMCISITVVLTIAIIIIIKSKDDEIEVDNEAEKMS